MKSYKVIEAEIEKLKREAALARKRELKSVIASIRKQIAAHGLMAEELGLTGTEAGAARKSARKASAANKPVVGAPKYRDPVSQKTWTGRGKPPLWIVGAKDRSVFLIGATPAKPAEASSPTPAAAPGKTAPSKAAKAAKAAKAGKTPKDAVPAKAAKPAGKRAKPAA